MKKASGQVTLSSVSADNSQDDSDGEPSLSSFTAIASTVKFRNLRKRHLKRNPQVKAFERRYTELGPALIPEQKRIDYVLVHKNKYSNEYPNDPSKSMELQKKEEKRERFESSLKKEGFDIQKEIIGENVFVKLHCPFKRLCAEAEMVKLEMPLHGCANYPDEQPNCLNRFLEKYFETDNEMDYVSAPFMMDRINLYEGYEDPTHFFRPAIRSMLVDHILINIDIRTKEEKKDRGTSKKIKVDDESRICGCLGSKSNNDDSSNSKINDPRRIKTVIDKEQAADEKIYIPGKIHSLPYLLMKGVYTDSFILHEESECKEDQSILKDKYFSEAEVNLEENKSKETLERDPRKSLNDTWTVFYKFQPLWKIRNYFGEMIALYFAWVGEMTNSLWIPMLVGFGIFLYGLKVSVDANESKFDIPTNISDTERIKFEVQALLATFRSSFDNDATPYFALIICVWGTLFLERWKRKNATLAYEWDVDNFEHNEPDRPQFYGLKVKKDPVTQEPNWFYPFKKQMLKFAISISTLLFMMSVVLISVVAVITYRLFITFEYCSSMSAIECLITSSLISAILNAVSILILGKLYEILAFKLTEWENHRTQTQYDDALVTKMFAFQFVNSYASCFYIAFFRGRFSVFGYTDECVGDRGTCMSQLSFQVLILMIIRPFPRILKDLIIPLLRKLLRSRPNWCCRINACPCDCCNKINIVGTEDAKDIFEANKKLLSNFLERERLKSPLGDFTLNEYTEKVIQYGFLMLFAASFPLAPLLAILLNLIDIRIDAKRMLWSNRRPIAYIRQDIGKWFGILNLVNTIGVITNGFLIGFTSSWAYSFDTATKLTIVLGFEHIVFALKFLIAYLIPDVPRDVRLSIRREKYQVAKILEDAKYEEAINYNELVPQHKKKRKHRSSNYDSFVQLDEKIGKPQEDVSNTVIPEENVFHETTSVPQEMSDFDRSTSAEPQKEQQWYVVHRDISTPKITSARTGGDLSISGVEPQMKNGDITADSSV
uniref:Anoctamin n=1 Tax=Crassostrea virginica TaxID=6565 RepID=A0A8B8DB05_CRAVI|nr:anoctamin-4-like isoform X1 [Crassostrea virginica]XP_022325218.1 anoctamin-4-like isoform X1 [Crassostrea virginica]XP_022325219.1 anoctamin-4-like isoform X1 [Crassostrea virginica]